MARQLSISQEALGRLLTRARAWKAKIELAELRNGTARDVMLDKLTNAVRRAVYEPVAEIAGEVAKLRGVLDELSKRAVSLEEAFVGIQRAKPAKPLFEEAGSAPTAPRGKIKASKAPGQMWLWIVQECAREIGPKGTATAVGRPLAVVETWLDGTVPDSLAREALKVLLASLWGRELFSDFSELEERRVEVLKGATNAGVRKNPYT